MIEFSSLCAAGLELLKNKSKKIKITLSVITYSTAHIKFHSSPEYLSQIAVKTLTTQLFFLYPVLKKYYTQLMQQSS